MLRRAISVAATLMCGAALITACGFIDEETADFDFDDTTTTTSSEDCEDRKDLLGREIGCDNPYEQWEYDNLGTTTSASPTAPAMPTATIQTTTATATATKTQTATKTATQTATKTATQTATQTQSV